VKKFSYRWAYPFLGWSRQPDEYHGKHFIELLSILTIQNLGPPFRPAEKWEKKRRKKEKRDVREKSMNAKKTMFDDC